jgi:hypothetical protein
MRRRAAHGVVAAEDEGRMMRMRMRMRMRDLGCGMWVKQRRGPVTECRYHTSCPVYMILPRTCCNSGAAPA